MKTHKIESSQPIDFDRWLEFFDQFSDSNKGRSVTIEIVDQEMGDQELIHHAPLFSLIYDPVDKGNDLVIETGQNKVSYTHTIDAPTEVVIGQDDQGIVQALQVVSQQGRQTLLKFD